MTTCTKGSDASCVKDLGAGSCCAFVSASGTNPITGSEIDTEVYSCQTEKIWKAYKAKDADDGITTMGMTAKTYCAGAIVAKLALGAVASIGMMASF